MRNRRDDLRPYVQGPAPSERSQAGTSTSHNGTITAAIDQIADRRDLTAEEAAAVLHEIMGGRASEAEIVAFLIALRTKGETVEEIVGLTTTMRKFALRVHAGEGLVDTAGTGGGPPTFNVSTTAALVAAGAGCRVAKHGNRSWTSRCGSADVLEALGARIDLEPSEIELCIREVGFGFMLASKHHTATGNVVRARRALAVRTIFNFLGPLTNPAGVRHQVVGVSDPARLEAMAATLSQLGTERAMVVSSADGMDEFSISGPTHVVELKGGQLSTYEVTPEDAGLERVRDARLEAGMPQDNARVLRGVLQGVAGAERELTLLNAAAAIYVADRAESLREGAHLAAGAIDSGAAEAVLDGFLERAGQAPAPPT